MRVDNYTSLSLGIYVDAPIFGVDEIPNPIAMTIQENNRIMQVQLLNQAKKSREKYEVLSTRNATAFEQRLAVEHLTRAIHFENIARNMLML